VKKFLFAVAAGFLFTAMAWADDPPVTTTAPAPTAVVGQPIIVGSTVPMTTPYTTTAPARRGLFGRLRARNTGTVMSAPVYSAPMTGGTIITTPSGVPSGVPMPMPTTTRPGGTSMIIPGGTTGLTGNPIIVAGGTSNGAVIPAGGIVTASGVVIPAGGITTSNGTVIPAGSITTTDGMIISGNGMTMPTMMTSTAPQRMGLIARMRARRGY
jgi:hypothetical protein